MEHSFKEIGENCLLVATGLLRDLSFILLYAVCVCVAVGDLLHCRVCGERGTGASDQRVKERSRSMSLQRCDVCCRSHVSLETEDGSERALTQHAHRSFDSLSSLPENRDRNWLSSSVRSVTTRSGFPEAHVHPLLPLLVRRSHPSVPTIVARDPLSLILVLAPEKRKGKESADHPPSLCHGLTGVAAASTCFPFILISPVPQRHWSPVPATTT